MSLTIHLSGPNAPALAAEIEAFCRDALALQPTRQTPPPPPTQRGEFIDIITLILAIPGGILATLDLAERARLGQRVETLLQRLRRQAGPQDHATLTNGTATPIDLTATTRDAVLDRLERP